MSESRLRLVCKEKPRRWRRGFHAAPERSVHVHHHVRDQAGGQGDQDDVVVGVNPAIAPRRRPQAIEMGVAHIVAAIGVGQGVTPLPAVSVVARLDPIIAVAGRIVIAAPGAAIIAEVRPAAPPVAVIAIPTIGAAVLAPVAAIFPTVLSPVASIISPIAAPFPAVLPVVPAIVPPRPPRMARGPS